ncbi:MAG: glycosyltransferase family protein [Myxococcota bacterium]
MASSQRKPVLFFGVNSEGMGHATRARPVIEALSERYEVHVFCGGRARQFLSQYFPHVHNVWFCRLIYRNNTCNTRLTLIRSFLEGPYVLLSGAYVTLLALLLRPVAIITDFESLTSWAGMLTFTKVVALDNQGLIKHGALPPPASDDVGPAVVARRVMFWTSPVVHRTLISSFYQPALRPGSDEKRVRYVPVAVRPHVLARMGRTRTDGPVLVYQTSTSNQDLPGTLRQAALGSSLRFVVYGAGRTDSDADGRVQFRAFSEDGFLDDLCAAPFVVVNGGHSTIVEALALGKPVLAEPVRQQYEQSVNVHGLEALGVGRGTRKLSVPDILSFAHDAEAMRTRAAALRVVDNDGLFHAVEKAVAEVNPARGLPPRLLPAARSRRAETASALP